MAAFTIEQKVREAFKTAVEQAYPDQPLPHFDLVHPDNEDHGDYAANVALILAKQVGANPHEVAQKIAKAFPVMKEIAKVDVAGPGFLNITLTETFLRHELKTIHQEADSYGTVKQGNPKTILFEFGQPNTHKIPHIGHLFSYCYGESCVRLLEATGNNVFRANYQGDIGLHVAKCLWAYRKSNRQDPESLEQKVNYLQQCYEEGSLAYEEDHSAKQEIDALNRALYNHEPSITPLWGKTRAWSVDYYKQFEKRIGAHFDTYYFESQTSEVGKAIVTEHVGDVFEQDQGAVVFRGETYGLHTRVFLNSVGNPTYEAKDIGLMAQKVKDVNFDLAVYTTASEQNDYWRVLFKVFELLFPDTKQKLKHIGFGMINLTTGKMSSRTGQIVTAFDLLEMVKQRISETVTQNSSYTQVEVEEIAEVVAIGAIKYSFLKTNPLKDITFDIETSIASQGNSGPYLQYAYARAKSVLRKAAKEKQDKPIVAAEYQPNKEEQAILRWLYRFPEVVEQAAQQYAPHVLANFLFELAQRYSYFYNQHQILNADPEAKAFRLEVTQSVAQVIKNGLYLLGIQVTEKI